MHLDIITAHPKLLIGPFDHSIIHRAKQKGIVSIEIHDLRNYGLGKHKNIDDYQYGGGAGMVLMVEPLDNCIMNLKKKHVYDHIIFMTPDGERLTQNKSNELSMCQNLLLICGHYKGIDERIRNMHVTDELSIGDYVLSGGELAAAVFVDSVIRLIPGVLNNESSALTDSFQNGLLSAPVYTRPHDYKGYKVPDVLLSGHEKNIEDWRFQKSLDRTKIRRPDLLD